VLRHALELGEVLRRQAGGVVEARGLEVARRQRGDGVEGQQVGQRAELAVLGGGRAEAAAAQVLGGGEHRGGIGRPDLGRRPHGHGLEELGAHHGAQASATGMAAVVRDGGVAHEPLAGGADGRDPPGLAQPLAQAGFRLGGGQAP
jgi:hypothetical protein